MTGPVDALVTQPKRMSGYPDYIDDPDGLERFRDQVLNSIDGHDMAVLNLNSLARLIDTIERLRFEGTTAERRGYQAATERVAGICDVLAREMEGSGQADGAMFLAAQIRETDAARS